MERRIRPTRSGLFAIELLIAVGIFTLCAAICVGLFIRSEVVSQDSADLNHAVSAARSAAEDFKAAGGDLERTAALTGGTVEDGRLLLVFDSTWQRAGDCGTDVDSVFLLELTPREAEGFAAAQLQIRGPIPTDPANTQEGETLLTWDIAALEVTP